MSSPISQAPPRVGNAANAVQPQVDAAAAEHRKLQLAYRAKPLDELGDNVVKAQPDAAGKLEKPAQYSVHELLNRTRTIGQAGDLAMDELLKAFRDEKTDPATRAYILNASFALCQKPAEPKEREHHAGVLTLAYHDAVPAAGNNGPGYQAEHQAQVNAMLGQPVDKDVLSIEAPVLPSALCEAAQQFKNVVVTECPADICMGKTQAIKEYLRDAAGKAQQGKPHILLADWGKKEEPHPVALIAHRGSDDKVSWHVIDVATTSADGTTRSRFNDAFDPNDGKDPSPWSEPMPYARPKSSALLLHDILRTVDENAEKKSDQLKGIIHARLDAWDAMTEVDRNVRLIEPRVQHVMAQVRLHQSKSDGLAPFYENYHFPIPANAQAALQNPQAPLAQNLSAQNAASGGAVIAHPSSASRHFSALKFSVDADRKAHSTIHELAAVQSEFVQLSSAKGKNDAKKWQAHMTQRKGLGQNQVRFLDSALDLDKKLSALKSSTVFKKHVKLDDDAVGRIAILSPKEGFSTRLSTQLATQASLLHHCYSAAQNGKGRDLQDSLKMMQGYQGDASLIEELLKDLAHSVRNAERADMDAQQIKPLSDAIASLKQYKACISEGTAFADLANFAKEAKDLHDFGKSILVKPAGVMQSVTVPPAKTVPSAIPVAHRDPGASINQPLAGRPGNLTGLKAMAKPGAGSIPEAVATPVAGAIPVSPANAGAVVNPVSGVPKGHVSDLVAQREAFDAARASAVANPVPVANPGAVPNANWGKILPANRKLQEGFNKLGLSDQSANSAKTIGSSITAYVQAANANNRQGLANHRAHLGNLPIPGAADLVWASAGIHDVVDKLEGSALLSNSGRVSGHPLSPVVLEMENFTANVGSGKAFKELDAYFSKIYNLAEQVDNGGIPLDTATRQLPQILKDISDLLKTELDHTNGAITELGKVKEVRPNAFARATAALGGMDTSVSAQTVKEAQAMKAAAVKYRDTLTNGAYAASVNMFVQQAQAQPAQTLKLFSSTNKQVANT